MDLIYKPMSIDPLFWKILGLPVNDEQELSSRLRSAWTISPPSFYEYIGQNITNVDELADLTLSWTGKWVGTHAERFEIRDMLHRLGKLSELSGSDRTLAICLSILRGDFETAWRLSGDDEPDKNAFQKDDGGMASVKKDGSSYTFFDKARLWLTGERRKKIRLVD